MLDIQLVPPGLKTANSSGEGCSLAGAKNRVFLVELKVTQTLEQQALEVTLEWSAEGTSWGKMAVLPQQFYTGTAELGLDLRKLPEVQWVRARWELERWGRGGTQVCCDFNARMREIEPEPEPHPPK